MVKVDKFWEVISDEVKEYLSNRYYDKTRCLLTDGEIKEISEKEIKFMSN